MDALVPTAPSVPRPPARPSLRQRRPACRPAGAAAPPDVVASDELLSHRMAHEGCRPAGAAAVAIVASDELLTHGMGHEEYVKWVDAEYGAGRHPPIDFGYYFGDEPFDDAEDPQPAAPCGPLRNKMNRGLALVLQGLAGRTLRRGSRMGAAAVATSSKPRAPHHSPRSPRSTSATTRHMR